MNLAVTDQSTNKFKGTQQFSTFTVQGRIYGIEVLKVQEVVRAMPLTQVPHAPKYVKGLINLRGQIATAIGVLELFNSEESSSSELMNIVCNINGVLVSLLVDEIGDVFELPDSDFHQIPPTIPENVRKFISGVYQVGDKLMSVIDLSKLATFFQIKKH